MEPGNSDLAPQNPKPATDFVSIDYKLGLSYYGDHNMYKMQLSSFDTMTLEDCLQSMYDNWRNKDIKGVERDSRKLKGASGCRISQLFAYLSRQWSDF